MALERHHQIIREYVRNRHGIYALYRRDKLYYVGLANNLRNRLKHHLRDRHRNLWDRFSIYLTIGNQHLKELESLLLRITQPPGNRVKGKFAKSEDLQHKFSRDIRSFQKVELYRLLGKVSQRESETLDDEEDLGRKPVLAQYVKEPADLRAIYKGKRYTARLRRDGSIRFRSKLYNSPSMAGQAVLRRSCNGWTFWQYERAPGDWVPLRELRK